MVTREILNLFQPTQQQKQKRIFTNQMEFKCQMHVVRNKFTGKLISFPSVILFKLLVLVSLLVVIMSFPTMPQVESNSHSVSMQSTEWINMQTILSPLFLSLNVCFLVRALSSFNRDILSVLISFIEFVPIIYFNDNSI